MLLPALLLAATLRGGSALPPAQYKATCPVQGVNPLFLGQGVPGTNFGLHHVEVARDIHWLSTSEGASLVGYLITGWYSHQLVLVPYSQKPTFVNPYNAGNGGQYIPLGVVRPTALAVTTAIYSQHLVLPSVGQTKFIVHPCFSTYWDGRYPPGS